MADRLDLTHIKPQRANANKHTPRGMKALEESIQRDGWVGAITVAADLETFDGSARTEVGVGAGFEDAIVVRSRGDKPIIHIREDIPTADDPRAKRLGIAANRVAELNLGWDADVLAELDAEDGLPPGLFYSGELDALLNSTETVDPSELWKGMPEFEQDALSDKYKSLIVHFERREDYEKFAQLVGQTLTEKSNFIWFPYKPTHGIAGSMQGYQVVNES